MISVDVGLEEVWDTSFHLLAKLGTCLTFEVGDDLLTNNNFTIFGEIVMVLDQFVECSLTVCVLEISRSMLHIYRPCRLRHYPGLVSALPGRLIPSLQSVISRSCLVFSLPCSRRISFLIRMQIITALTDPSTPHFSHVLSSWSFKRRDS
jgi:hypothetical protein